MQKIIGNFLFYERSVDAKIFTALNTIASSHFSPTEYKLKRTHQFIDYDITHSDTILTYTTIDMLLAAHSDASYLREPKARSYAWVNFFLTGDTSNPTDIGSVLNIAQIIKAVMNSAEEAHLGEILINA